MKDNVYRGPKRYGWLITFALINWALVVYMILKVDPETIRNFIFPNSFLPMMILLFGGLFWIFVILTMSTKISLRWALGITFFVMLKVWMLGTTLNGVLILGLLISTEIYYFQSKENKKSPTSEVG